MEIDNSFECYVALWRRLEATRQLLAGQSRRFCVRNILRTWFPRGALPRPRGEEISFDDLVWHVCHLVSPCGDVLGWTELPPPFIEPHLHRDLLRAITQVAMGINHKKVRFKELDRAYMAVFPNARRLNVGKKRV